MANLRANNLTGVGFVSANNGTVWSDYITSTTGSTLSNYPATYGFDGNLSNFVYADNNSTMTWTPPNGGIKSGRIEVYVYAGNTHPLVRVNGVNTGAVIGSDLGQQGNWVDVTSLVEGHLKTIEAFGYPISGTARSSGWSAVRINGEILVDGEHGATGGDGGVVFHGDMKMNSQGYMYFPTGNTAQRVNSRGRAVIPGGYNPSLSPVASRSLNTIEYLEINTTANALDFGDLSFGSASGASCGSSTRGLVGGSYISPSVTGSLNNIDYITIATTGNGADFGDLTQGRSYLASFSSSTRGIWAGGVGSPTPSPYMSNTIDYVTIATAGNATDFGDSADVAYYGAQGASSPTRGIWSGGSPSEDMIQYVTIASTGNANEFGNLSADRKGPCEASSSTRCIIVGGYTPTVLNTMEYITIATTGNAKDFGDLAFGGAYIAGTSNSVRAVWSGRYTVPATHNTIQYSTIQTLGNAIDFGDLISAYTNLSGATSDSHGGL